MSRNQVFGWLWERGISIGEMAMITGASMETTWRTVRGQADDQKVLAYLRKKGCPEDMIGNRKTETKGGEDGNRRC
jgi:hypothetical protein